MKFIRTILLVLVMVAAGGCFNIRIPDPPDIDIHGEINNGDGTGANGEVKTNPEK